MLKLEVEVPVRLWISVWQFAKKYNSDRVIAYWCPTGDELILEAPQKAIECGLADNFAWITFLAIQKNSTVLKRYNLGDSEKEATQCLFFDLKDGSVWVESLADPVR